MFGKNIFKLILFLLSTTCVNAQEFAMGIKYAPVVLETPLSRRDAFSGNRAGVFLQWQKNKNAMTLGLNLINGIYTEKGSTPYDELKGGSFSATYSYYFFEKKNWRAAAKIGAEYTSATLHFYWLNRDFPSPVRAVSPIIGVEGAYKLHWLQVAIGMDVILMNWLDSIYKPVHFVPYVALKFHFN